jgi:hypothetical protein
VAGCGEPLALFDEPALPALGETRPVFDQFAAPASGCQRLQPPRIQSRNQSPTLSMIGERLRRLGRRVGANRYLSMSVLYMSAAVALSRALISQFHSLAGYRIECSQVMSPTWPCAIMFGSFGGQVAVR